MKPLAIREITLTNFKNYSDERFQLGEKFNLVYGLNGTGKTNLLDGLYYVCVGKSYFTPFDHKVVRYGESFFRIEATLNKGEEHAVVIKVKPSISKEILVDGTKLDKISDHLGFIPVVISAPRDIDLIIGTGQTRRRYIDHLLCQTDSTYLHSLVSYNHLLQLRNGALKQAFDDLKRMIDTYDEQMAPHASYIFNKRKWLIEIMAGLLVNAYGTLSEKRENVSMTYHSALHEQPYEVLADRNWELDKYGARTHGGIHRDDFDFLITDMPAKEFGSQGQIKSVIFALHLSKYKILGDQTGHRPILILDDIFDKLDERRLARLMEILLQPEFGQVLLSDTNRNRVGDFVPSHVLREIKTSHA